MKLNFCLVAFAAILFTACSSNEKKIMVISKGKATIDVTGKTIAVKDGAGSEEAEMLYNTADKVVLKVKSEEKEVAIDIPENGYYILNTKNDTLIGSYQNYTEAGSPTDTSKMITQEMIQQSIDSLIALTEGKNVSAANKNYYVLPFTAVKVTNNVNAFIVGPFHNITTIEKDGDKMPEVYRFFSIKEIREKIEKQKAMTVAKPIN
ncbi:MAG TPA: hypothetical protein PLW32_05585 [Chitinophagaceae bacterium]|jgi:hypothetical protein|nr:hypothetical protein [Chitinophagaceae bacterium]